MKWTIKQRGETIGIFNTAADATEYAHKVLGLPASIEVDHGDHIRSYLYADQAAMDADTQGCHPRAAVIPCDADHVPDYRA